MIRNLTMGEITIWDGDKPQIRIPSEGDLNNHTQAISGEVVLEEVEGIRIVELVLGKVHLPEPEKDTRLIVTRAVAEAAAAQGRTTTDLLVPSSPVRDRRDESNDGCGVIIGWRQLSRLPN